MNGAARPLRADGKVRTRRARAAETSGSLQDHSAKVAGREAFLEAWIGFLRSKEGKEPTRCCGKQSTFRAVLMPCRFRAQGREQTSARLPRLGGRLAGRGPGEGGARGPPRRPSTSSPVSPRASGHRRPLCEAADKLGHRRNSRRDAGKPRRLAVVAALARPARRHAGKPSYRAAVGHEKHLQEYLQRDARRAPTTWTRWKTRTTSRA